MNLWQMHNCTCTCHDITDLFDMRYCHKIEFGTFLESLEGLLQRTLLLVFCFDFSNSPTSDHKMRLTSDTLSFIKWQTLRIRENCNNAR